MFFFHRSKLEQHSQTIKNEKLLLFRIGICNYVTLIDKYRIYVNPLQVK